MSKVLRAKVSVNNENEFYENEDQEDLKDAEDGIIQNDTMGDIVSSALSDSPSFWRGIQSRIDRAERVASEAKSSSKDIQMFHSSNDVKKLNKAISGWKTSSGIVQEVVGTEFVGLSEVMQELTQLRGSFVSTLFIAVPFLKL